MCRQSWNSEFAEDLAALDGSEVVQARALRRIRESDSYQLIDRTWTWEAFCLNRAGMSRSQADRQIGWINFVDKIAPMGAELSTIRLVATSERRARPLIGLSDRISARLSACWRYSTTQTGSSQAILPRRCRGVASH